MTGGANFPPTHTCLPVCDLPTNAISINKGVLIHSRPLPHLPTRALAIRCLRTSHSVLPAPGLHCLTDGAFAPSTHCLPEPGLPHSLSLYRMPEPGLRSLAVLRTTHTGRSHSHSTPLAQYTVVWRVSAVKCNLSILIRYGITFVFRYVISSTHLITYKHQRFQFSIQT